MKILFRLRKSTKDRQRAYKRFFQRMEEVGDEYGCVWVGHDDNGDMLAAIPESAAEWAELEGESLQ